MPTNDEIINKKRIACPIHKSIEGFCKDDAAEMLDEARDDTAKQIFKAIKDLDDVLVNPDYDDLKAIIEAVKKQYKVD